MRHIFALLAFCALLVGVAVAQQYPTSSPDTNAQQYPQSQDQNAYPQSQSQYPTASQDPNAYPQSQGQYPQNSYPQGNQPYGQSNAVVPAGTQIQIRTNENINADQNTNGRTYSAEIANDVMGQNGQVLIPKGSPATLVVSKVGSGNLGTSNQVALGLESVNINGRTYNLQSNDVNQSGNRGIGANKRTAEMTGGGALLGTLIGAVAGGGKGAAIGAVLGGAGGAAAQVLTKGNEVKVPAETVLTFKLDQPLSLY